MITFVYICVSCQTANREDLLAGEELLLCILYISILSIFVTTAYVPILIFLKLILNVFKFLFKFQLGNIQYKISGVQFSDSALPYNTWYSSQVPSLIPIPHLTHPSPNPSGNHHFLLYR